jgi:hypothetical protein
MAHPTQLSAQAVHLGDRLPFWHTVSPNDGVGIDFTAFQSRGNLRRRKFAVVVVRITHQPQLIQGWVWIGNSWRAGDFVVSHALIAWARDSPTFTAAQVRANRGGGFSIEFRSWARCKRAIVRRMLWGIRPAVPMWFGFPHFSRYLFGSERGVAVHW